MGLRRQGPDRSSWDTPVRSVARRPGPRGQPLAASPARASVLARGKRNLSEDVSRGSRVRPRLNSGGSPGGHLTVGVPPKKPRTPVGIAERAERRIRGGRAPLDNSRTKADRLRLAHQRLSPGTRAAARVRKAGSVRGEPGGAEPVVPSREDTPQTAPATGWEKRHQQTGNQSPLSQYNQSVTLCVSEGVWCAGVCVCARA